MTPENEKVAHGEKVFGSFAITNVTLKGSGKMLTLAISYQRDLMGIFMTTYLPTIFLNMLSQCTHYYGDSADTFDPKIATNLTILMVLTAWYCHWTKPKDLPHNLRKLIVKNALTGCVIK